ncbi:MAG: alpha/beta fold hydrolase [Acidiferrobacterales bacterium]
MSMRTASFLSVSPHAFHRIAFTEWGDPDNERVLICVHGLTRNGRDFDFLAAALEDRYRVVCPDVVGRGRSEWLTVKEDYIYATYDTDMAALIARLDTERVDWVGTSMGGLIGMLLAALPNTPIRRLVVNDIGPFIPKTALERIGQYVGTDPHFENLADLEAHLREVHAGFGPLTDKQWGHLTRHSAHKTEDGRYALMYDPAIALRFTAEPLEDMDLWAVWDQIRCPVLLLRGTESDVLLAETAEEMQKRGPRAQLVEFPGVGHAPALMAQDQIDTVRNWLSRA